jgi:hypothetical protein
MYSYCVRDSSARIDWGTLTLYSQLASKQSIPSYVQLPLQAFFVTKVIAAFAPPKGKQAQPNTWELIYWNDNDLGTIRGSVGSNP